MNSKLNKKIGIEVFSTKSKGISGKIKQKPEDFIVQEISTDKEIASLDPSKKIPRGEKEYTHFTLVKRDWNQALILKKIARRIGQSRKRFSHAGTKDKFALTAQRISAWRISPEQLAQINIKDCELGDFSLEDEKLELGDLWGNSFTAVIREIKNPNNLEKTLKELEGLNGLPNFFGTQRFGMRLNNHLVGKELLKGNIEKAIKHFLTDTTESELEEGRQAREFLGKNWGEFKQALKLYPKFMRFERALLDRLNRYPKDFVGAFKQLSKNTYKIFTHAYQSFLFNKELSYILKNNLSLEGEGNLIGYSTEPNEIESRILKKEKLSTKDFKVKSFPEASVRGGKRKYLAKLEVHDYNLTKDSAIIKFDLRKGAYATIFLRELIK